MSILNYIVHKKLRARKAALFLDTKVSLNDAYGKFGAASDFYNPDIFLIQKAKYELLMYKICKNNESFQSFVITRFLKVINEYK